jgi:two-component system OmpR family response regulator
MDVAILHWPTEEPRRCEMQRRDEPRLLLVDATAPAPVISDLLEDWVRLPTSNQDFKARVDGLRLRCGSRIEAVLSLDADGLLHYGDRWVSLPPIEAALTTALLEREGAVVSRDDLLVAGWPDEEPSRNVLDVHVLRLRRRLEPLRVAIRTIRSRGYVLER